MAPMINRYTKDPIYSARVADDKSYPDGVWLCGRLAVAGKKIDKDGKRRTDYRIVDANYQSHPVDTSTIRRAIDETDCKGVPLMTGDILENIHNKARFVIADSQDSCRPQALYGNERNCPILVDAELLKDYVLIGNVFDSPDFAEELIGPDIDKDRNTDIDKADIDAMIRARETANWQNSEYIDYDSAKGVLKWIRYDKDSRKFKVRTIDTACYEACRKKSGDPLETYGKLICKAAVSYIGAQTEEFTEMRKQMTDRRNKDRLRVMTDSTASWEFLHEHLVRCFGEPRK